MLNLGFYQYGLGKRFSNQRYVGSLLQTPHVVVSHISEFKNTPTYILNHAHSASSVLRVTSSSCWPQHCIAGGFFVLNQQAESEGVP